MKVSDFIKPVIKAAALGCIAVSVIWVLRFYAGARDESSAMGVIQHQEGQSRIIFLGSSRTQSAIDSSQFESAVYNLASSDGNLFNSLCLLNALELDSSAIVLIELGTLNPKVNRSTRHLITELDKSYIEILNRLNDSLQWKERAMMHSEIFNYAFWENISIGRELKLLTGTDKPGKAIGFNTWPGECGDCEPLFLQNNPVSKDHLALPEMVEVSIQRAESQGAKIYFYMPLSYYSALEQEKVIDLYSSIPKKNKIIEFHGYEVLKNEKFYADRMHLNPNGAKVLTEILKKSIANNSSKK